MGGCGGRTGVENDLDTTTSRDAGPPDDPDAPMRDAPIESPDAGPPRFPPLPECPLQFGQVRLSGAETAEGLTVVVPGRFVSGAAGGGVAAILHGSPWQVSETRADRSPLLHDAFDEPATETVPFETRVEMSVAGDGTIWLTRTDVERLDEHGRSTRPIGRQVVSIYCGVRTVHTRLDETELVDGGVVLGESGIPIPTPDGATLMVMPDGRVERTFLGETEPFLTEGEVMSGRFTIGGRLFLTVASGDASYLVEYDGAPVSAADALLDAPQSLSIPWGGTPELPLVFCGDRGGTPTLLAPTADGADEQIALATECPQYIAVIDDERWARVIAPSVGAGFYRWDPGEAPVLMAPLDESPPDLTFVPHGRGVIIVYYGSDTSPRYRLRYVDPTRSTDLGACDTYNPRIQSDDDLAYFVDGLTIAWLSEDGRVDQTLEGLRTLDVGQRDPGGGLWLTMRVEDESGWPNRASLLRVRPGEPPEVVLPEIEEAIFRFHEGFGYGDVFAYDDRMDVHGTHFVEGTSTVRRVGGNLSPSASLLSDATGEPWILYGDVLARLRGGTARTELRGISNIVSVAREAPGRTWFFGAPPSGPTFLPRRLMLVTDDAVERRLDLLEGENAWFIDAGVERDFIIRPWGIFVGNGISPGVMRLCPFTGIGDCIAMPEDTREWKITAERALFAWSGGGDETRVWSRVLR